MNYNDNWLYMYQIFSINIMLFFSLKQTHLISDIVANFYLIKMVIYTKRSSRAFAESLANMFTWTLLRGYKKENIFSTGFLQTKRTY